MTAKDLVEIEKQKWADRFQRLRDKATDSYLQSLGTSLEEQNGSAKALDYGSFVSTGNTARDTQALANTSIQRTYQDAKAAGINPTAYLLGSGASSASASGTTLGSTSTAKELKIAQQNADANMLQAKASMLNAHANSAKAVSSFLPNKRINIKSYI